MSTEEKKPLLPENEEVTEVPSERPHVPVVDYSKKSFYDYLGLKNDASKETIKSTASELLKKYNPITNPDEIDKYQSVLRSDRILNTEHLKKYYDEYGDLSIALCEIFQHYYSYVVEEKPGTFLTMMLYTTFVFLVLFLLLVFISITRYRRYFFVPYIVVFIPGILMVIGYVILALLRSKRELKHVSGEGEKKEKKISEIKMRDYFSFAKVGLISVFIFTIAKSFDNDMKCFYCACIPYILFETVILIQDFQKFKIGVEAINTGKDVDNYLLKGNVFLRYLIGINNTKCEMNKEGKKGACASLATALFALNIFKSDVLRFVQNVLFFIALNSNPSLYIIYFTPTVLLFVASVVEMIYQGKIGYVRGTHESMLTIMWVLIYGVICLDLIFTYYAVDVGAVDFVTHTVLFIVEVTLFAGFEFGVLQFVPIIEFKLKHDEMDAPI